MSHDLTWLGAQTTAICRPINARGWLLQPRRLSPNDPSSPSFDSAASPFHLPIRFFLRLYAHIYVIPFFERIRPHRYIHLFPPGCPDLGFNYRINTIVVQMGAVESGTGDPAFGPFFFFFFFLLFCLFFCLLCHLVRRYATSRFFPRILISTIFLSLSKIKGDQTYILLCSAFLLTIGSRDYGTRVNIKACLSWTSCLSAFQTRSCQLGA